MSDPQAKDGSSNFLTEFQISQEIREIHQFFADWFNGKLSKDQITRVTTALADDFVLISPSGVKSNYEELIKSVSAGYNTNSHRSIWVDDITMVYFSREIAIVEYTENQVATGNQTKRISTAVFRYASETPNHCQWVRVHETWFSE